jgi:hypothetical protein
MSMQDTARAAWRDSSHSIAVMHFVWTVAAVAGLFAEQGLVAFGSLISDKYASERCHRGER